jgi:aminoglycoside phosphotransferase family enzyme
MLEALLERDAVTSDMLTALTGKLAAFYQQSEQSEHIGSFGSRETVDGNWQENFDQTD